VLGHSPGYPAWNLLYYSLLCSIPTGRRKAVVIETGTNRGLTTIVMAQALKDLDIQRRLETVDLDANVVEVARRNVDRAGLSDYVNFNVEDAQSFLKRVTAGAGIDFVLIDDLHTREQVVAEIDIVCPRVVPQTGTVYFDNTLRGGVAEALIYLKKVFGGNLVEFPNCSWGPPGNAIWQTD
jgi:predicted O-methyltransferase YrrM